MIKKSNIKISKNSFHVGIIPDGSRRWAKQNKIENYDGKQSGEVTEKIVMHLFKKYSTLTDISLWALSTKNMERPTDQKNHVFNILKHEFINLDKEKMITKRDVKVNVIGSRFNEIPSDVQEIIMSVVNKTKNHKSRNFNICIGYGGKEEILDAVISASRWIRKNPTVSKMHEHIFENFLMVQKPLDIVIRTGGEKRLSGFMLYQIEYAEIFFVDTLWPDFTTKEVDEIMKQFNKRNRRFGK